MRRNKKRSRRSGRRRFHRGIRRLRSRRGRGAKIRTRSQGTLLADRTKVKLSYSAIFDASLILNLIVNVIKGNSLFDPDSNTTGQPTGFDQYAAFYRFYYVSGCKMLFTVINRSTTDSIQMGVVPATNQLSTGDFTTMVPDEWPYCRFKVLGPLGSSRSVGSIKHYMSTKKIYGRSTSDSDFQAAVTSDPSFLWYFNQYLQGSSGTSTAAVTIFYKITYYAQFYGRQEIAHS